IPGWCSNAVIRVNGRVQSKAAAGTFATIDREWKDGDRVEIRFPMEVEVIPGVNNSVSVRRGPLVYALGIKENWKSFEKNKVPGFESYDVTPESTWNYALALDSRNPARSFKFENRTGAKNPFETGKAPVALRVQARPLESWKLRTDGRNALDPPVSPVASNGVLQTLELVPFGSQMLRVTDFPVLGVPPAPVTAWKEDFSGDYSQRWVAYKGSWMRDGRLNLPRQAKAVAPRARFSNLTYDADVLVGEKGDAGILFRTTDPTVGTDGYIGYYVGISAELNEVVLGKSNNGWSRLARASKILEAGRWHHVRVEAKGAQIKIWVDDMTTPVLEATDASFAYGALGVRSYADKASFGTLSAQKI
ncbi:DUF1080 domain-containing protein, partial [bacterium]